MNVDYSNIAWRSESRPVPEQIELPRREFSAQPRRVSEAYRGTAIVGWQGKIERQLQDFAAEASEARNHAYADKLRAFLATWRANPLSGSINVETVESLLSATEVPAVDSWRYADYFSNLRDQLRKLKASVEELPMGDTVPPSGRAPSSSPPSSFGPTDTAPSTGNAPGGPASSGNAGAAAEADAAAGELTGEAPENTNPDDELPGT